MPQKFKEWLVFTAEETLSLEPLRSLITTYHQRHSLSEEEQAMVLRYVSTVDLALLIKHALHHPEADSFYKQPVLQTFWDERWKECSKEFLSSAARDFEGKPQPTLHSFELLTGVFLYAKYKKIKHDAKNKDDETIADEYLALSANLGFFTALNVLFKLHITDDNTDNTSFFCAQRASHLYLSPGYLLLASFYYQRGYYLEALQHLILAKKLAPFSDIFIHNAYLGLPIEDVVQQAFKDWEKGISLLAELADIPMAHVVKHIYPELDKEVGKILSAIPKVPEEASSSIPTSTLS